MIDREILDINRVICSNITRLGTDDRGLLAQNILAQLRNFVEHISLKIYNTDYQTTLTVDFQNFRTALNYVQTRGQLKFLSRFHKLLQSTASHYTLNEENSERLMLKYYEYLIRIKQYLKSTYELEVLENLASFPIKMDSNLTEYYEKIIEKVDQPSLQRIKSPYNDRYYIQKIKPFFVGFKIYYQVTFTRAVNVVSKFDRIIAFTKHDISANYAVRLEVSYDTIDILGKSMPIQIIDSWEVSIRPCEIRNFAKIFNLDLNVGKTKEFAQLNKHLTQTGMNLVEIVNSSEIYFNFLKEQITHEVVVVHIVNLLQKCRDIILEGSNGRNVIRYLLLNLRNNVIKRQLNNRSCELLSNLNLEYGCIPFDKMPFNTSLRNHNPRLSDLFNCIEIDNRQHEILARHIKNNTEYRGLLYTPLSEVTGFDNIDLLIQTWNDSLYHTHTHRKLELFNDHIYIKGYEEDTLFIVEHLKQLSSSGIKNYSNSVESWIQSTAYNIDSTEKESFLKQMFENSKVGLIYGAAGTGKSTMINHIAHFFGERDKLYLANTNPAVDNLKRKVNAPNSTFKTITKFLLSAAPDYDILIIDECSTVSNSDMVSVLRKATVKLVVLVGDIYQIESILFGNWFNLIRSFVPNSSIFELTKPYRTTNTDLLTLWTRVRKIDDNILECLTRNNYTVKLDESIFESANNDEIILCLNYDGLYGINNINRFLQSSNKSPAITWGTHAYKANDPIIFNEATRWNPLIYNNLKGKIVEIKILEDGITFDIEIDKVINEMDAFPYDFQLLDNSLDNKSVIRFVVNKYPSTDDDDDVSDNTVVPFQVAYAVSIHKAQGLEYKSVKVVITEEVEEMVSHNIFYTAITRARENLKIYWTPETEKRVLEGLEVKFNSKDSSLLKVKYGL